ncbi:hypothetical protein [Bradymonas sediminis]|uniref:Uncharacterized protein n=1 Tax=Bradymonas sediminis TaxID=1548548 RepID=A0A2Z4FG10_9DELT|nr:hypothetical protein [Bradymonas sediminis]AWV87828.1 hypothetical protein DN745_00155 [Bradymonas sediminis]TDP73923.1 hypothetical protein DFR33_105257 [Bradymonas sediminis]
MKGINSYLELVESGRDLPELRPATPIQDPVLQLLSHAHQQGHFEADGAWQLAARVSRRLEKLHNTSPPGGWARLCALCCGCGILRPERETFVPNLALDEALNLDDASLRRSLCEAFTRKLVPPASAAGLFIMLGIHPAWGLWVAHSIHNRNSQQENSATDIRSAKPGWRDTSIFEPHTAQAIEEAVFTAIAIPIAALRKLDPTKRYPIDAFARLTRAGCRFARASADAQLHDLTLLGLQPFLQNLNTPLGAHNQDFAAADLLDAVLVPAGIAQTFDDGTFCVHKDSLADVQVGELDPSAQELRLIWMLADQAGCQVA